MHSLVSTAVGGKKLAVATRTRQKMSRRHKDCAIDICYGYSQTCCAVVVGAKVRQLLTFALICVYFFCFFPFALTYRDFNYVYLLTKP